MDVNSIYENFSYDVVNCINNGSYHSDINHYNKGKMRDTAMYIVGSHLLTLGRFNMAAEPSDIQYLQDLYVSIITWLITVCPDIRIAKLYLLRSEKVLDKDKVAELNRRIQRVECTRGTKAIEIKNLGRAEAYGYIYRLEEWLRTICRDSYEEADKTEFLQSSKHILKELKFLAKIQYIPHIFDAEDLVWYYFSCFRIFKYLGYCYEAADMENKAIELFEMAASYGEDYKKVVGRAIKGSDKLKKTLTMYTREQTSPDTETEEDTDNGNDEDYEEDEEDEDYEEDEEDEGENKDTDDSEEITGTKEDECREVMKTICEMLKKIDPDFAESLAKTLRPS